MRLVILRVDFANVGLVKRCALSIKQFIISTSERGAIVMEMVVLMLMRVVKGQVWVLVDICLLRDIMAMLRDVMVCFSVLACLNVDIDGMYRILDCNHVHSLLLSCLSRYLGRTVERRKAKATRKATEVIGHGDMVEIYHTIYCGRTTQTRTHLEVLPNWTERPSKGCDVVALCGVDLCYTKAWSIGVWLERSEFAFLGMMSTSRSIARLGRWWSISLVEGNEARATRPGDPCGYQVIDLPGCNVVSAGPSASCH